MAYQSTYGTVEHQFNQTKFIHPKTNTFINLNVSKGQNLDVNIDKLKQYFRVAKDKELIMCNKTITGSTISGIMNKAPYHNQLKQVYCYEVSYEDLQNDFKIIYVSDEGFDCPELEFLVHKDLTLWQVFDMYKFTKKSKHKSFGFAKQNDQQLPLDTIIYLLPNQIKLKISPNTVRVLIYQNGQQKNKARLQVTFFRKFNAKDMALKLSLTQQHANLKYSIQNARSVNFNYFGIQIPSKQIITPNPKDQVFIIVTPFVEPILITLKQQHSSKILFQTRLEKQTLTYKKAQQIVQLIVQIYQCYNLMSYQAKFVSKDGVTSINQYYKQGQQITILLFQENHDYSMQGQFSNQNQNQFQSLKSKLRQIFKKPQNSQQNKMIYDHIALYMRSTFD